MYKHAFVFSYSFQIVTCYYSSGSDNSGQLVRSVSVGQIVQTMSLYKYNIRFLIYCYIGILHILDSYIDHVSANLLPFFFKTRICVYILYLSVFFICARMLSLTLQYIKTAL